ncbi:hypothetical protein HYH03_011076 [Edaphochlamys debaryana]|uniref:DNA ligase (NAD(+)) n=1 Tax=Edaphochlamys debaryana TaxID=47281 RepID=A0A835XV96_9CHLO|nr:hypothetical protein HYH03_011076 [Edaphochlamys debaryana]|eukprot:KAG2490440.1 hypothetical protein HYH03_011076 [Edaphochlamys debaryana]
MRVAAVVMCSLVDGILSRRPWPGCWAELAADVWRQVAACMPVECRSIAWEAVAVPVAGLAQMLDVDADASGSHCGGGGPPGMAAALAGGALPFLERLLRRSGSMLPRTPQEAGQAARAERLLRALIREGKHLGLERTVMSLLAYGDGLQAAAFMASVTKQRQRTAALLSLGSPGYIGFWLATGVLAAAIDAKVFDGAAVLAQRTERTETWALVLSIAVGEWLPALSSLLWLRLLESARACVATQQAWGTSFRIVMVTSMCAGFLSPSRSGDGWRRDAIRQAGLVPLVGAAMQVFPGPSCGMEESSVADWAVQLACAAPDEVLRAHGDLAWRPEAVRALAQESESSGARLEPVVLCRLAQHLEAGLPEFKGRVLAQPPDPRLPNLLPALSPLLVPPAEARRRLGLPPACANPACVNLAGDSEIALQRQKCGGLAKLAARIERDPTRFFQELRSAYQRRDAAEKRMRALMKEADLAYYNSGTPLLSDAAYDTLRDLLEAEGSGQTRVGAPVTRSRKVHLPHWMGSLDKVKDAKALASWRRKHAGPVVVSDKLDGVSALLVVQADGSLRMYSRGDGREGQDISFLLPRIVPLGLNKKSLVTGTAVRGELIITRDDFQGGLSGRMANARNAVSGIVNSKTPDPDTAAVTRFVAYELVMPAGMAKSAQLKQLRTMGFTTVWSMTSTSLREKAADQLLQLLLSRKEESPFEVDGIVVEHDAGGQAQEPGKNPSYAFAFKSASAQTAAQVSVEHVEWNASKDGLLKPTIVFEPVSLGGVTIRRATGHNAEFIFKFLVGPGAVIEVTRSGDVIPYILCVVRPAPAGPQMPAQRWEWGKTHKDAVLLAGHESRDVLLRQLSYFFKTLGAKGVSDKTVERLFNVGYTTVRAVLDATPAALREIPGFESSKAASTSHAVRSAVAAVSCVDLMSASNAFGAGFGKRKIEAILAGLGRTGRTPDAAMEVTLEQLLALPGVQAKTAEGFLAGLTSFRTFLDTQGLSCGQGRRSLREGTADGAWTSWLRTTLGNGRSVVFTGVRSKALEVEIAAVSGVVRTSVSANTDVIVFADTRGKYEKALQLNAGGRAQIMLLAWADVRRRAEQAGVNV